MSPVLRRASVPRLTLALRVLNKREDEHRLTPMHRAIRRLVVRELRTRERNGGTQ